MSRAQEEAALAFPLKNLGTPVGQAGKFVTTDGINASWGTPPSSLPSQSGQDGKFLQTVAGSPQWAFPTNDLAQVLTDAATINWNMALGNIGTVTLGGNRTIAAPSNLRAGSFALWVLQDGSGSRTLTWNALFKWAGGAAPLLSTAAGALDVITFTSDGTRLVGSYLRGAA